MISIQALIFFLALVLSSLIIEVQCQNGDEIWYVFIETFDLSSDEEKEHRTDQIRSRHVICILR